MGSTDFEIEFIYFANDPIRTCYVLNMGPSEIAVVAFGKEKSSVDDSNHKIINRSVGFLCI